MNIQLTALSYFIFNSYKNLFFFYFEYWQMNFIRDLKVNLKSKMLKHCR